jgi:hypothetical protein
VVIANLIFTFVTVQALLQTHKGNVVDVFHQTTLLEKGKSLLSCLQMKHFGAEINNQSLGLPGDKQCIQMDQYQIPLAFKNGLPYLKF